MKTSYELKDISSDYVVTTTNNTWATSATLTTAGGAGGWSNGYTTIPQYNYSTTSVWPADGEIYPKLPNALGVIYVEDGKIKCRTLKGEDIILGEIGDGDDKVSIKIIAVIAKKLLEKQD